MILREDEAVPCDVPAKPERRQSTFHYDRRNLELAACDAAAIWLDGEPAPDGRNHHWFVAARTRKGVGSGVVVVSVDGSGGKVTRKYYVATVDGWKRLNAADLENDIARELARCNPGVRVYPAEVTLIVSKVARAQFGGAK